MLHQMTIYFRLLFSSLTYGSKTINKQKNYFYAYTQFMHSCIYLSYLQIPILYAYISILVTSQRLCSHFYVRLLFYQHLLLQQTCNIFFFTFLKTYNISNCLFLNLSFQIYCNTLRFFIFNIHLFLNTTFYTMQFSSF